MNYSKFLNEIARRKTLKVSIQFREVWKLKLTLKNNKETVFLKIMLIKIAITLLKMVYWKCGLDLRFV